MTTPAPAGTPTDGGDRRHRLGGVARDQLQVHLLGAHELDRLARVGPQRLLHHDQRQRGDRAASARRRGSRAGRPRRGRRRRPGGPSGCAPRGLLQRHRQATAPRGPSSRPGAPSTKVSPRLPPRVSPLHFHSEEKGTSAETRSALPGKRSATASRVRLRSPELAAKRASAFCAAAALGVVGHLDGDQLQLAGGQRAGLVHADRVHGGQRLGRRHLLDQRVEPRQPDRGDGEGDAHQQHQALGDQRDQAGRRGLRRLVERGRCARSARRSGSPPAGSAARCRPSAPGSPPPAAGEGGWRNGGPRRRPWPRGCPRGRRRPRSSPSPRSRTSPRAPAGRAACGRPSASPVSIDSSRVSPRLSTTSPSATSWSPGSTRTQSPGTTSSAGTSTTAPSRIAFALGATSSARLSSVSFAFSSWRMPM